jgi:hypothetical protein
VSEDTFTDARIASATVVCAHCHELPHAGRSCLDAALTALAREREAREDQDKKLRAAVKSYTDTHRELRAEQAARARLEAAVEYALRCGIMTASVVDKLTSALRSSRGEGT